MNALKCPFCGAVVPDIHETFQNIYAKFDFLGGRYDRDWGWMVSCLRCPACEKISTFATGIGSNVEGKTVHIFPESTAIQFPEYVPPAIREDYEEAYSIVTKSPKASATLARRCLQGMIRDFWNIHEKNLNAEITSLRPFIPAAQWNAIDAVRRVGNIGAHMEHDVNLIVDVSPDEAKSLLSLIELLVDKWYIDRHDSEQLYEKIATISDEKLGQLKP